MGRRSLCPCRSNPAQTAWQRGCFSRISKALVRLEISKMRRREFTILLAGAAVALPFIAHAQSGRLRRIGVLMGNPEGDPRAQVNLSATQSAVASPPA